VTVRSIAASSAGSITSSSPLTSMRIAWNVRFAGWPPVRRGGKRGGRLDRPGDDDCPSDAVGESLVAVSANDAAEVIQRVAIDDVCCVPTLRLVHTHVERRIVAIREPTIAVVELR
jgi:hypothetical protein